MSLDLDWSLLDAHLATSLLARLNRSLSRATRPDFVGPITLTSLDFGTDAPDVRLTHIGDVWRQFLDGSGGGGGSGADVKGAPTPPPPPAAAGQPTRHTANDDVDDYDDCDDCDDCDDADADWHPRTHAQQRPSQHLSKLAEANFPFTNVAGGGGTATGAGGSRGGATPRLQTFRQYTPSDIQPVHGGGAGGSTASFPASSYHHVPQHRPQPSASMMSMSLSGSGGLPTPTPTPTTLPSWGAGLGTRAAASGYFSPWHAGGGTPSPSRSRSRSRSHHAHAHAHAHGSARPAPAPNGGWRRSSSFAPTHAAPEGSSKQPLPSPHEQKRASSPPPASSPIPSLQLQFSVLWSTNTLKLGINTSLLINHPTPAFMELPLSVSVIGLGLQAGCVVAFEEGDGVGGTGRKGSKVHISLIDPEDDGGGRGEASGEDTADGGEAGTANDTPPPPSSAARTPAAPHPCPHPYPHPYPHLSSPPTSLQGLPPTSRAPHPPPHPHPHPHAHALPHGQRPPTVGERLIPHVTLESSVGQSDKHVLRNVGKVEKFLSELIRRAVEDELVWPNFYTIALPA